MAEAFIIPEGMHTRRDPVEAAVLTATYNSMGVVYEGQQTRVLLHADEYDSRLKGDGSLVTGYDKKSQRTGRQVLRVMLPGVPFRGEETLNDDIVLAQAMPPHKETVSNPDIGEAAQDPLDGTRPFAVGAPTSTVITVAYKRDGSVYGAAIGEPATGRLYSAFGGRPTTGRLYDLKTDQLLASAQARTWKGKLLDKGQAFIDNNLPHPHNGHVTLTGHQHIALRTQLMGAGIGVMEMGSNGAHQLYVASGGDRAAMAITTARGIQEDTSAGAFLVEHAGGAVQRYNAVDGVITPIEHENPDYDLLVVANTADTLRYAGELLLAISR